MIWRCEGEYLDLWRKASYLSASMMGYEKEVYPLKSYPQVVTISYPKISSDRSYIKKVTIRKFRISLKSVRELASSDWSSLKNILAGVLREHGYLRADRFAEAFVEEARARALVLVRKHFGREYERLVDKVAKYIIAFALSEEFGSVEEDYISI